MLELVSLSADLTPRQRDYLALTVYVLASHGRAEKALALVEAMLAIGGESEDLVLARAVLRFRDQDFKGALDDLDLLDRHDTGKATSGSDVPVSQRTRKYLRARCYWETGRMTESTAIARGLTAK